MMKRQIVALNIMGLSPISHPFFYSIYLYIVRVFVELKNYFVYMQKFNVIFKIKSINNEKLIFFVKNLEKILHKFISTLFVEEAVYISYSITHLPNKICYKSYLKSPHVFKKAWEHFELVVYKKQISIVVSSNLITFENLKKMRKYLFLNAPRDVQITFLEKLSS